MNPVDFVQLAIRLSAGDEASKRSAVSLAYYGVYHEVRRLLAGCGIQFARGATSHDVLSWCLQHSGDADAAYAGTLLKSLREARNAADYDLEAADVRTQAFVNLQLKRAQEIQSLLLATGVERVRDKVRDYASTVLKLRVSE
jgi:uncharacterized protein (UPF0332 family)